MSLLGNLLGLGGGGGQEGIGNKSNQNETNYSTTNTSTDKSVNAGGDGSIAAGQGANVTINNLSEGVAKSAIEANSAVASKAIDSGLAQTAFVTNTLAGLQESAARDLKDTQDSANLAVNSTVGLANRVSELAADAVARSQAPEATSISTILKPILYVAGVIVVAIVLIFFSTRKERNQK